MRFYRRARDAALARSAGRPGRGRDGLTMWPFSAKNYETVVEVNTALVVSDNDASNSSSRPLVYPAYCQSYKINSSWYIESSPI